MIDCPTQDERVLFLAGCTFHSGEKCSYSCTSGYEPTSSDSIIECNEGVWNIEKPCAQGEETQVNINFFQHTIVNNFLPIILTLFQGAHKNHLIEIILLRDHNICFSSEIRK